MYIYSRLVHEVSQVLQDEFNIFIIVFLNHNEMEGIPW